MTRRANSRRTLDEAYFAEGVSPENAYDYGFILADGGVNSHLDAITVELSARDRVILEEMRERFGSDAPIVARTKAIKGKAYQTVAIHFSSRRLCADLLALGIGPRKDFQDYPLPPLTGASAAAAIRGLFDGDGTVVRVLTRNPPGAKIAINNRRHTLEWASAIIQTETGISGLLYPVRSSYMYQVIAHEDVVKLADWFYSSQGPCLLRKRDKLMSLIHEREAGLEANRVTQATLDERIVGLYAAGLEMTEIAAQTGIPIGIVARSRKRMAVGHRKPYKTPIYSDVAKVKALYASGIPGHEVARISGFSLSTVRKLAFDLAAARDLGHEWATVRQIREMRLQGRILREIAGLIGTSRNTVASLLKRYEGQ